MTTTNPETFMCPKCGGPFFRTTHVYVGNARVPDMLVCGGTVKGDALPVPGQRNPPRDPPCGWSDAWRDDHECWVPGRPLFRRPTAQ